MNAADVVTRDIMQCDVYADGKVSGEQTKTFQCD